MNLVYEKLKKKIKLKVYAYGLRRKLTAKAKAKKETKLTGKKDNFGKDNKEFAKSK